MSNYVSEGEVALEEIMLGDADEMSAQNPFATAQQPQSTNKVPGLDTSPTSQMFDMDLSGVESSGSVPAGTYEAYLEKLEPGVTQGGAPKWTFYFRVVNHPQYAGRQVQDHCSINALWKTKRNLAGLGVDVSGHTRFDPEVLRGLLCIIVVTPPDEGQTFPNVDDVIPWPQEKGGFGTRYQQAA